MATSNFRAITGAAVFGLVAVSASVAHAQSTVNAKYTGVSPGHTVEITITNTYYTPAQTKTTKTRAGQFNWTGTSITNPGLTSGNFVTFCTDWIQNISSANTYTYLNEPLGNAPRPNAPGSGNPTSGSAANNGLGTSRTQETLLRQLFAAFYPTLGSSADNSAALQVSIWKVLYETDPAGYTSITSGNFKLSGASATAPYASIVNSNLSFLLGNPNAPQATWLSALTSTTAQDQILVTVPAASLIPEPSSLGLLAPAAMLLGRRRN